MTIEQATIYAACIGGGAALAAPLISHWLESQKYISLGKTGKRPVEGSWRGVTHQRSGPQGQPIDVDLALEFSTKGKFVRGTARVRGGGAELNVALQGGFVTDTHLFLNYTAKSQSKVNFGYCLLAYNAEGKRLKGEMMGFGHVSEQLISGEMDLQRVE